MKQIISLVVFALSFAMACTSWQGMPFPDISTRAKLAKYKEHDARYLLVRERVEYDIGKKTIRVTKETEEVIEIQSSNAVKSFGVYRVNVGPAEEIVKFEGRVYTRNSKTMKFDGNKSVTISAEHVSPALWFVTSIDQNVVQFRVPPLESGSIIHVKYRKEMPYSLMSGVTVVGRRYPVVDYRLTHSVSEGSAIRTKAKNLEGLQVDSCIEVSGKGKSYCVGVRNVDLSKLNVSQLPLVYHSLAPLKSNDHDEVFATWKEAATWYAEQVDSVNESDDNGAKALAGKLSQKSKTHAGIARETYLWVQKNIRYVAILEGEGRMIPRSPKTVLDTRYGDCKDMSNLVVQLLRANGIGAHLALVSTRHAIQPLRALPNIGIFNHCIARTTVGNAETWMDCTSKQCPWGEMPGMDEGVFALLVKESSTELVTTPSSRPKENQTKTRFDFRIGNSGCKVTRKSEYSGCGAQVMRAVLRKGSSPEKVLREDTRFHAPNAVFDTCFVKGLYKNEEPLRIAIQYEIPRVLMEGETGSFVPMFVLKPDFLTEKELPFSLESFYKARNTYELAFRAENKEFSPFIGGIQKEEENLGLEYSESIDSTGALVIQYTWTKKSGFPLQEEEKALFADLEEAIRGKAVVFK